MEGLFVKKKIFLKIKINQFYYLEPFFDSN